MLYKGFPHVPVLRAAFFLPGGLFSAQPFALINSFNIGYRVGLEHLPTENTGVLPSRENIPENQVQLPATRITALHIHWARHNLNTH